ncbi:heat shock 70 kDa protein 12A-like [Mercenaria mercenaria]|uniref:heat shock 70 kDa protein 12A-like n=1 Tax=Mercenaria mercenaria TaxID=6596 RepID=UPI00234E97B0|nr:heat shock 70 kDa protein 12A-like [Mercenaria mercenaria]
MDEDILDLSAGSLIVETQPDLKLGEMPRKSRKNAVRRDKVRDRYRRMREGRKQGRDEARPTGVTSLKYKPQPCTDINSNKKDKDTNSESVMEVYEPFISDGSISLIGRVIDLLVGSIDIGTTYSGWAISFPHEFESDPTKVYVKKWHSGDTPISEKTPTVLLIKPDGTTLEAFGYDAENRYKELIDKGEHKHYYYFQKFKMKLHKQHGENISLDMTLQDEMGRMLPAINVFSLAIKFLVDDMHREVKDKISIERSKAGIAANKLSIAFEPEAASIYYRNLSVDEHVDTIGVSIASFSAGTKYMVLDAGGGIIDITLHEVQTTGTLKEIKAASGGAFGGTLVDEAFEQLLIDIVGENVYSEFKHNKTGDWLDLWREFENKKRNVSPKCSKTKGQQKKLEHKKVEMKIPFSLCQIYERINLKSLEKAVESSEYCENIHFAGGKISFGIEVFRNLFNKSLSKIIQHIEDFLPKQAVCHIRAILMVGGFSESPMLKKEVELLFPSIDVIIPAEASSSIMRGALIFGHIPKSISERVLKYTYGVGTCREFVKDKHPESKLIKTDTGPCCKDVFSKHIERDKVVKVGEPQVILSYFPVYRHQTFILFQVFASKHKDPLYTDDDDCKYVGEMSVMLPDHDGDLRRKVKLSFTFSGTEIKVTAEDEKTGNETKTSLNFLG